MDQEAAVDPRHRLERLALAEQVQARQILRDFVGHRRYRLNIGSFIYRQDQ